MNFYTRIFSFIICFIGSIECAQEQQTLFLRGNELFSQGHYQDAFNVYQQVTNKNFAALYNMGLCCLRQNKKAEAILFCKRAEKHAESYKEFTLIEELLEFDENKELRDKGWYEQLALFCKKGILTTPIIFLQLLVLVGLIFLIVCWYMRWYRKRIVVSAVLCMLWLLFYYLLLYKVDFMQRRYGVVLEQTVSVFAGPDASFYKKADLSKSDLVVIIQQQNQFYKIRLGKLVGWIDSHNVELV